jgi:hypothetical protein
MLFINAEFFFKFYSLIHIIIILQYIDVLQKQLFEVNNS